MVLRSRRKLLNNNNNNIARYNKNDLKFLDDKIINRLNHQQKHMTSPK